jgi:lipoteichoic acid synthase
MKTAVVTHSSIKRIILLALLFLLALASAYLFRDIIREKFELALLPLSSDQKKTSIELPRTIAHAAGDIDGRKYSNSLEALNINYRKGYRFFEMDFNWTTDRDLVAIHDWHSTVKKLSSGNAQPGKTSTREFLALSSTTQLTHMTISMVAEWLQQNRDAYIVTDIKEDNLEGLTIISGRFPDAIDQIIPQVYRFPQYDKARGLGFRNVILTLYLSRYTDKGVVEFSKNSQPYAITMPIERALSDLPKKLSKVGIPSYSYGISEPDLEKRVLSNGVHGLYTLVL